MVKFIWVHQRNDPFLTKKELSKLESLLKSYNVKIHMQTNCISFFYLKSVNKTKLCDIRSNTDEKFPICVRIVV